MNKKFDSFQAMKNSRVFAWQFVIALVVYGLLNWHFFQYYSDSWKGGEVSLPSIAFVIAILSFLTLLTGVFQWSTTITVIAALLLGVSLTTNFTSAFVAKAEVSRADIVWMWAEAERVGDVVWVFGRRAVVPLIGASIGVAALWWLARRLRPVLESALGASKFRAMRFVATTSFIFLMGLYGFILPVGPSETNLYAFGLFAASQSAPSEKVLALSAKPGRYRKVVLLMDESVRADAFELKAARALPLTAVDLGTALSTGNCSASSNAAMRWGVRFNDVGVGTDLRVNPTIWQFAKRAGYHVVMIDGQSTGGYQDFLSKREAALIDEFIPASAGIETDVRIAEVLRERFGTARPEFIYVVMRGSHFPYAGNMPSSYSSRKLSRLEGYLESVAYVTGGFLRRLNDPVFRKDDVLVLYTSDHGQLFSKGSTHCSGEYLLDEYLVPMVIMGGGPILSAVSLASSCWTGRADHQNLRTTALVALGYAENELTQASYPTPLTTCPGSDGAIRLRGKLPWVTSPGEVLDLSVWNGSPRKASTIPP